MKNDAKDKNTDKINKNKSYKYKINIKSITKHKNIAKAGLIKHKYTE